MDGLVPLILIAAVAFYFLPTFVASHRAHRQTAPIAVLNLFLGWTLVGWVVALAWAVAAQPEPSR